MPEKQYAKTKELLRKTEERYRMLYDQNPAFSVIVGLDGTIKDANKAAFDELGYTKKEVIGKRVLNFIIKEQHTEIKKIIKDSIQGKFTKGMDVSVYAKDGSLHQIMFPDGKSALYEYGKITGIVFTGVDITKRKITEEALRESEEKFRLAFENSKDAIIWAETETGKIMNCNKSAEKLLEKSKNEIVGQHQTTLHPPEKAKFYNQMFKNHIRKKGSFDEEAEIVTKTGKIIPINITASLTSIAGKTIIQGIFRDISDRKKTEKELRIKDKAIASSINAIAMLDIAGRIIYVNQSFLDLWGYAEFKEVVGKPAAEFWKSKQDALKILGRVQKIKNWRGELIAKRNDETEFIAQISASLVKDEDNNPIAIMGSFIDVTERKKAEQILKRDKRNFERLVNERTNELLEAQKELDKAKRLSDIGTLAATVAHELRNPLGVIRTAIYNIHKKSRNSSLDKHIYNIEKKIKESNQIINNLLSYRRIKEPYYKKVNICRILDECISSAEERFYPQKVVFKRKYKLFKGRHIEADPLQIKEVFNNILNNACQSILGKKGKIAINLQYSGASVMRTIFMDNGIGIEQKDLNNVFEPFFTRKPKGTGLGLTICNELVDLHGGKISIKSRKSKGTTVIVTLPIRRKK